MNREAIIRMAREAGGARVLDAIVFDRDEMLERFAVLVAQAEREECIDLWNALQIKDEQIAGSIKAAVAAEREAIIEQCEALKFIGEHHDFRMINTAYDAIINYIRLHPRTG